MKSTLLRLLTIVTLVSSFGFSSSAYGPAYNGPIDDAIRAVRDADQALQRYNLRRARAALQYALNAIDAADHGGPGGPGGGWNGGNHGGPGDGGYNGGGYNPGNNYGEIAVGGFTKSSFDPEKYVVPISQYTNGRGYSKVITYVTAGERNFTVIFVTIMVRINGQWVQTPVAKRADVGRNEFNVNIPPGATELLFSLDHGKASSFQAFIQ